MGRETTTLGDDAIELTERLCDEAYRLGFSLAGVCRAVTAPGFERFQDWLDAGYAGEMRYLADRQDAYAHPDGVLDGVKSLVMLGWNYRTVDPAPVRKGQGRIASYAWGEGDYHDLIHDRLKQLAAALRSWRPESRVRGVVDTAPLLEREFGQLAGLGWIGKNTLLLNRQAGSWFFLAALLTDLELAYSATLETDHCGTCRACLDACPTQAFPQPYVLDASRCISYLTIELRSPAPDPWRSQLGDWLFGCDICQEVCPWNRRASRTAEPQLLPRVDGNPVDLIGLLACDDASFRAQFRRTPLWRAKRRGILRNAAYVLGNQRCVAAIPALVQGLADAEPLVRGACGWALGCFHEAPETARTAAEAIRERLRIEADEQVRRELGAALERLRPYDSIDETEFRR